MGFGVGGGVGGGCYNDNSFVLFLILILLVLGMSWGGGYNPGPC